MFGRGRGEAAVLHLGSGAWAVVDSFNSPASRQPVALEYLSALGVDASAIVLVIATHWDDDHIHGLARIAQAAPAAEVVFSTAIRSRDFLRLAARHQQRTFVSPHASGTREFSRLLKVLEVTSRIPTLAQRDTVLWNSSGVTLTALSPSPQISLDALSAAAVRALDQATRGDSVQEPTPNESSIVLMLRVEDHGVVLGGDLETGSGDTSGWSAVRRARVIDGLAAAAFKAPHHGSSDADDPEFWAERLVPEVRFAVTRFNGGRRFRPSADDRARLRQRSPNGWVLGRSPQRRHLHGVVGRRIRMATRDGIWRATGPIGSAHWQHELRPGSNEWTADVKGAIEPV